MLDVIVLSAVLSKPPIRGNTREETMVVCFDSSINEVVDKSDFSIASIRGSASMRNTIEKDLFTGPSAALYGDADIATAFRTLADEWSARTQHISSNKDLITDPNYRQIVKLGWSVVPLLLKDMRDNKRFWFPALYEITNVRPFDPSDAGNGKRMLEAWMKWGRLKGLI
jgi:hypothetical protein